MLNSVMRCAEHHALEKPRILIEAFELEDNQSNTVSWFVGTSTGQLWKPCEACERNCPNEFILELRAIQYNSTTGFQKFQLSGIGSSMDTKGFIGRRRHL